MYDRLGWQDAAATKPSRAAEVQAGDEAFCRDVNVPYEIGFPAARRVHDVARAIRSALKGKGASSWGRSNEG